MALTTQTAHPPSTLFRWHCIGHAPLSLELGVEAGHVRVQHRHAVVARRLQRAQALPRPEPAAHRHAHARKHRDGQVVRGGHSWRGEADSPLEPLLPLAHVLLRVGPLLLQPHEVVPRRAVGVLCTQGQAQSGWGHAA